MPASLQGLPVELLLNVLETFPRDHSDLKLKLYKAVRSTCTELDNKTLLFFGSTYFKKINISFTHEKVLALGRLSRSPLACHMQHVTIDFRSLFDQTVFVRDQDSEADSDSSSSSDDVREELPLQVGDCKVREDLAKLIKNGACSRILRIALSAFRTLRYLHICPPHIRGRMLAKDVELLRAFWLMMCKLLLDAVLPGLPRLETFVYDSCHVDTDLLGLPLSLLEYGSSFPPCLSSIQRLKLFMVNDLYDNSFPQNVEAFASLLRRTRKLTKLRLALTRAPASYFDRFARALPPIALHTLKLQHTTVAFEGLSVCIKTIAPTLQRFGLGQTMFTEYEDFIQLLHLLIPMQLEICSFGIIDVGKQGLDFIEINKMRAEELPDDERDDCWHAEDEFCICDWVWVMHNKDDISAFLSKDNDVDVGFWLQVISDRIKLLDASKCETLLLDPGV